MSSHEARSCSDDQSCLAEWYIAILSKYNKIWDYSCAGYSFSVGVSSDTQVVRAEYMRRGRPLRVTEWPVSEVVRFMKYHLMKKLRGDDLGAHAKMFEKAEGPSPMPEHILKLEAAEKGIDKKDPKNKKAAWLIF